MGTLRDALSDALGKSETGTLEAPVEVAIETDAAPAVETQAAADDRVRDERGRFTIKEPEAPAPAAPAAEAPVAAPTPAVRQPPTSWKKDYWGHWEKIGANPELAPLQDYIVEREGQYAKGVSAYKSQWDAAAPIYQAVQPYLQEFQQQGLQPQQVIGGLIGAHRVLSTGTPEQKLQAFAKMATDYGVPLQSLQTGQVDPQAAHIAQTVSQLQQRWQTFEQQQQAAQQAQLQQQIEAFKTSAPHFEAVKETMAGLLQSGVAQDLRTAYDKAIRLNDEIWQAQQAEQAKAEAAKRQAVIATKKAAAVSPKSSSPTGAMNQGGAKKGLRDTLSEQLEAAISGRF